MENREMHDEVDLQLLLLLPEELVGEILLRLPAISLLRFKCVCKSWWLTINSSRFKFQHLLHQNNNNNNTDNLYLLFQFEVPSEIEKLNLLFQYTTTSRHRSMLSYNTLGAVQKRSLIDPNKFENIDITCCCNGLILFRDFLLHEMGWWSLWNPTTGETKLLPLSPSKRLQKHGKMNLLLQSAGCGFDTKTMDYKVVTIYKFFDTTLPTSSILFDMYSLKANSWTTIASFSPKVLEINNWWPGVFSNGMLSWKAFTYSDGNIHNNNIGKVVDEEACISVHLSSGTIITTLLPSSISHHGHRYRSDIFKRNNYPLVYKESLALVNYASRDHRERSFDIWVLGEYGVKESWTKLFTIEPLQGISRVVGFWKDGKVFVQTFREKKFCPRLQKNILETQLLLLDTLTPNQPTTRLQILVGDYIDMFTYKENLFPLN